MTVLDETARTLRCRSCQTKEERPGYLTILQGGDGKKGKCAMGDAWSLSTLEIWPIFRKSKQE